jgi:hypothetical protein
VVRALALMIALFSGPLQAAGLCGFPGRDGSVQAEGLVNLWFASAEESLIEPGSRWLPVAEARGRGELQPGDLAVLIQMQGAQIVAANDDSYGDGVAGDGIANGAQQLRAGHFEFVRIEEIEPGRVRVRSNGPNSGVMYRYRSQEPRAAADQGRQRWQLVRVPQYENLTLSGALRALPWDGRSGGVLALDVRRSLILNNQTLNVAASGFRGGAALPLIGALGDDRDYRYRAPGIAELAAAFGQHASKGEGLAGTPRWLADEALALDSRPEADRLVVSDGYPDGSMARGAPANAGGGASSLSPDNQVPAGGGGGGGGQAGETGQDQDGATGGGHGGAALAADELLLIAGGGGGAGTRTGATYPDGSGGAGGGIMLIRAGRIEGGGRFDLRGSAGRQSDEGGGGGGGGGSLLLQAALADKAERHWLLAGGPGGPGAARGGAGGDGRMLSGGGAELNSPAGQFDGLLAQDVGGVSAGYLCRPSGMLLAGQIFEDNGAGDASAHDGQRQRGEAGLAGRRVRVLEGSTVHAETFSNNAGLFALELPEALADRALTLEADIPSGWHAVSARTDDLPLSPFVWQGAGRWRFTARREYLQDGIALALIRAPQWQTPPARDISPGSTQLFLFRYLPQTSGRVRFRYQGQLAGGEDWKHNFLLDPECDEASKFLDEGVSRWLPLTAGKPVCVRVRVQVPANASGSGSLNMQVEAETDLGPTPLKLVLPPLRARIDVRLKP